MAVKLTLAPDFQALCSIVTDEEYRMLEESLVEEGCQHPIVVWKCGKQTIIVDGHTRYKICEKHRIAFKTRTLELESRQEAIGWAARNQLGRRNVTEEQKSYLRGKLYTQAKLPVGPPPTDGQLAQSAPISTAARIGRETGVNQATVKRDEKYSEAIDRLAEKSQLLKDAALGGGIPKSAVAVLAEGSKSALKKLETLQGPELRAAVKEFGKPLTGPDYGKCPVCAGTKWTTGDEGTICAKCQHPHGEPAGDPDEERLKTQRQKTVKTVEALMRAFGDLQLMRAKPVYDGAIVECKKLLALAKRWK